MLPVSAEDMTWNTDLKIVAYVRRGGGGGGWKSEGRQRMRQRDGLMAKFQRIGAIEDAMDRNN